MTVENNEGNGVADPKVSDQKDNSVAYETYERTLTQAKQAKARQKEMEQELAAMKAEKATEEKSRLEEQGKYKELHEASEARAKAAEQETSNLLASQILARKREAVATLIGAVHKPEFLQFVNLDNVDIDNPDSIADEANRFKTEYPMALATPSASAQTNESHGTPKDQSPKTLKDMTDAELAEYTARSSLGT